MHDHNVEGQNLSIVHASLSNIGSTHKYNGKNWKKNFMNLRTHSRLSHSMGTAGHHNGGLLVSSKYSKLLQSRLHPTHGTSEACLQNLELLQAHIGPSLRVTNRPFDLLQAKEEGS